MFALKFLAVLLGTFNFFIIFFVLYCPIYPKYSASNVIAKNKTWKFGVDMAFKNHCILKQSDFLASIMNMPMHCQCFADSHRFTQANGKLLLKVGKYCLTINIFMFNRDLIIIY